MSSTASPGCDRRSRSSGTGSVGGSGSGAIESALASAGGALRRRRRLLRRGRAGIFDRQIEREGAAHARRAAQLDLAAEQVRELAADGEAEAGAAVFAAGAGVGLLERLEDDLLLLRRDADAGVRDLEGDDGGRVAQHRMVGAPAAGRRRDREPHAALVGELEGVRQQVLQHLLQALRVGDDAAIELGIDLRRRRRGRGSRPRGGTAATTTSCEVA